MKTFGLSNKDLVEGQDMSGHYGLYMDCSNCHFHGRVYIPKGTSVSRVCCPNCECEDTLMSRE